jgi:hypothetical protein
MEKKSEDFGKGEERASVKMAANLDQSAFRSALQQAEEARRYAEGETQDDIERDLMHSLTAIVMANVSLEAYINSIAALRIREVGKKEQWKRCERLPLPSKWLEVTRLTTNTHQTFDEYQEPFSSFRELVTLRNYAVHYKMRFKGPYGTRGPYTLTEAHAKLNAKEATKAVEAVRKMIRKFHEFDLSKPPTWIA